MSWSEIKKAVNTDLNKPLDVLVKEEVAKVLASNVIKNNSVIKSIQKGYCNTNGAAGGYWVTISAVDPKKCIIIITNEILSQSNATIKSSIVTTINATQMLAQWAGGSGWWQLIEFY